MNYKKEYKKYLASSILDTANNKIASTSFITAFAVYPGIIKFCNWNLCSIRYNN